MKYYILLFDKVADIYYVSFWQARDRLQNNFNNTFYVIQTSVMFFLSYDMKILVQSLVVSIPHFYMMWYRIILCICGTKNLVTVTLHWEHVMLCAKQPFKQMSFDFGWGKQSKSQQ